MTNSYTPSRQSGRRSASPTNAGANKGNPGASAKMTTHVKDGTDKKMGNPGINKGKAVQ